MQKENNEFWRLQKAASLSNKDAAKWLGVTTRQITRWRVAEPEAPKAVIMCLEYRIKYGEIKAKRTDKKD